MKTRLPFIISIVAILIIMVSIALGAYADTHSAKFTRMQALEYLDEAERSHQQVLDHPEMLDGVDTELMGNLAFHAEWVKRYQAIKQYILENGR